MSKIKLYVLSIALTVPFVLYYWLVSPKPFWCGLNVGCLLCFVFELLGYLSTERDQ